MKIKCAPFVESMPLPHLVCHFIISTYWHVLEVPGCETEVIQWPW